MKVASILTVKGRDVFTILPESSILDAANMLKEKRVGALVVPGAKGTVAGILSERDIVRGLAAHGPAVLAMTVGDLMTRTVVTCAPDNAIEDVMNEMTSRRIRHLPVIEDGALAGMVSIGDVVNNRLGELHQETDMLRSYISSG